MSDDARDDDELLAQVAGGDIRALEALYRRMRVQVFAVALAVTGDRGTAEDVLQDTFVRVYSAAPRCRPEARAPAWVLTIARHLALDAVRRRTGEPASGMADHGAAAPACEPDRIRLDVVNALLQHGEVDRQIVVLHDLLLYCTTWPGSRTQRWRPSWGCRRGRCAGGTGWHWRVCGHWWRR